MFRWLNQLDHHRWMSAALAYFFQNVEQHHLVLRFLIDLERLVVSFMLCRVPPYRRIDRYCDVLQAIHNKKDMFAPDSPLQLKGGERNDVLRALDGNMYLMPHVCRYVLLRLDAKLSEGTASYDYQTVSVEHVLPQRPAPDSQWMKTFPSKEIRDRYVHHLGNMVLLSRGKNINAENVDFDEKKRRYFVTTGGVSPFVITTQVLQMREWTPTVIEQRQAQLLGVLKTLWNL